MTPSKCELIPSNSRLFPFSSRDNMEPIHGSDLGLLTGSKAVQRILCPMAAQLCHLILALEREHGICPDIGQEAETLAQATEELAAAAMRLAEDAGDELLQETHPAAEALVLAGRKVVLAAGRVRAQPHSPGPKEELTAAAQGVLMETAKILRLGDAAGTRSILQAAHCLLEHLSLLQGTGDAPGAPDPSQALSDAVLVLSSLTAQHIEGMGECPQRQSLARALQLLQQQLPMLHAAKDGDTGCSQDQELGCSKDNTFRLMENTIQELTSLLIHGTHSEEPQDTSGTFSHHIHRLLALLSAPDPLLLSDSTISAHLGAVVVHCMLLAEASRPEQRLELVQRCQALLRLWNSICSPGGHQEGQCHSMRQEVQSLQQAVLTVTLCQLLDACAEDEDPLGVLVEGALSLTASGACPEGPGGFLQQLHPLIAAVLRQGMGLLRGAELLLALCTEPHTAAEVLELQQRMGMLLARIPALLITMGTDGAGVSGAEQLQSLHQAWAAAMRSLMWCCADTTGTRRFLMVAIQEMGKHQECCQRALRSQDPEGFSWHITPLCSWARWVVGASTRYMDGATDPIFRNGLLVWIQQLSSSIPELKAASVLCAQRPSCLRNRDVFSKALSSLMDAAQRVQDGLDGSNHPDLLSPLREHVRGADVTEGDELSPSPAGLKPTMDEAVLLQEHSFPAPSSPAGCSAPRDGSLHPVITALLAAAAAQDTASLHAACSALLQLSHGFVCAAKEALPLAEHPHRDSLGQAPAMELLTAHVLSLARAAAPQQCPCPTDLLHAARRLSDRLCDTMEGLAAVAGPWYVLSQQVLAFTVAADPLRGRQAVADTMVGIAAAVRFVAHTMGSSICPHEGWETFLQVQTTFARAQVSTNALLEEAASSEGSVLGRARLELLCVQWAVSTRVLLAALDQFIGRDVLLGELGSAVRNRFCPHSILAAVSERSLRLQEAARLSSCPGSHGHREILVLREEIRVLMEALLEASSTILLSPLPHASLCARWELLQRDLGLRAKALMLHLEKVNAEHLRVIRDVVGPALMPLSHEERERSKEAFEEKANRLMANVQWVRATLHHVLEANTQPELEANLLSMAEHLLLLTSNAMGSARQLLQSPGDGEHLHLESIIWCWAAGAQYLLTQLQAVQGIGGDVLELIRHHLQDTGDRSFPRQHSSTTRLFPAPEPRSHIRAMDTCPSRSGAATEAPAMQPKGPASTSVKHETESSDMGQGGPSSMFQVTKDTAARMLHMTQFLRRKGPITSKDQLVACARQMALHGQQFVTFGRALARLCLDTRCSMELLSATEQAHTISSQLSIVARVKAVTAESKSSSELLVSNTQNLVQAVLHILKAAEAACVKGLRQPLPDSEEAAAAALCMQWRRNLFLHRAKASFTSDRDELGLRRTRTTAEPSLVAMVQEQAPKSC